jgi:hypothetical protein
MEKPVLLLGSITDALPEHRGGVAVCGSHGGLYPGVIASRAGLFAVILNDAGIGLNRAGVAGVMALDGVGLAAAAAGCMSCRIGMAADMMHGGVLSVVNNTAAALGLSPGQTVAYAAMLLAKAPVPHGMLGPVAEARSQRRLACGRVVHLVDSASMVSPGDAGKVVITGSHGGLIGGDPARALKAPARFAVFNDAGGGKDGVGYGRLPALEARGIAAVTVSHDSARIGDAASALDTGVISATNAPAEALGARVAMTLIDSLNRL